MRLCIKDANDIIDIDFGRWLIQRVKTRIISTIKKYNFKQLEEVLNSSDEFKKLYDKQYSIEDLIIFASNNLICTSYRGTLTIVFDNNQFVPGFDRLRLLTLVKFVNYGNRAVKGCPIFVDALNYVGNNIDNLVGVYYML